MKINIKTSYKKQLKYSIYGVYGKKRKLITKGRFTGNYETTADIGCGEIIVEITRTNLWYLLLKWLANMFTFGIESMEVYRANMFYQLRISDLKPQDELQLFYRGTDNSADIGGNDIANMPAYGGRVFYCTSHPGKTETKKNNAVNVAFKIAFIILLPAAIILALYLYEA